MMETKDGQRGSIPFREGEPRGCVAEPDVARITRVVEEYRVAMQAGQKPDRQAFLTRCPEIADALAECLDALEFIENAAPQLQQSPLEQGNDPSASAAEIQPEGPLGDFRIIREAGRGGMGVVYEAVQISLGRRVALKVLPFAAAIDPKQLQRFKNEAQAAAHFQHTNIVPVYAVGCERGVHFYAMQFIEGQTLAAVIHDLRLGERGGVSPLMQSPHQGLHLHQGANAPRSPENALTPPVARLSTEHATTSPAFFRTVASFGVQAAEALEHAHQLGVIHRDIKPANLLVDAGGRLWITDFGLAHCQSQPGLTMTGDVLGTLRYMSPEQALAKRVAIDARTDVYSLGVTFYELLTLEPAYNGRDREELLRQIAFEEPPSPRRLNSAVPAELETIILKAMAKEPEERYGRAQELADDLRRFLEDKPIKAKRPSLWQRAVKWARRHKTVVRAALVVLLVTMVALAISTVLVWRANQELSDSFERERQNSYYQRIALTEREGSANNLGRMEQLLDDCPADLRGWEWRYLRRLRYQRVPYLHHAQAVLGVAVSPDGERIASSSLDGLIKIWDAKTGQELRSIPAHETLSGAHGWGVAFSPDGRQLALICVDRSVKIWDTATWKLLHSLADPTGVPRGVTFSPDGRWIAWGGTDSTVKLWQAATGEIQVLRGHTNRVHGVAFSCDGKQIASASADGTVKIWKVPPLGESTRAAKK